MRKETLLNNIKNPANIDKAQIAQEWLTIKNTMWNLAGLIRSQEKLHTAINILRNLQSEVEQVPAYKNLSKVQFVS